MNCANEVRSDETTQNGAQIRHIGCFCGCSLWLPDDSAYCNRNRRRLVSFIICEAMYNCWVEPEDIENDLRNLQQRPECFIDDSK